MRVSDIIFEMFKRRSLNVTPELAIVTMDRPNPQQLHLITDNVRQTEVCHCII